MHPESFQPRRKPRIGLTFGDPAGVGPELCLRCLTVPEILSCCSPIVIGDRALLERVALRLGLKAPPDALAPSELAKLNEIDRPYLVQANVPSLAKCEPGRVNATTGLAAYEAFRAAIDLAQTGVLDAIVTGPLHKEALHAADVPYPGHTEILQASTSSPHVVMMLTSEKITCSLVTTHIGLGEVVHQLTEERIFDVILLTHKAISHLRDRQPRLAVLGLNPHAGEHGLLGQGEEERLIQPAICRARSAGCDVVGPLPPDTAFLPVHLERYDAFVCMYHDQGLIPLKMLAFDSAVNVTLGLPIIRTSPDHGTALDLAWQGVASPNSFFEAIKLAVKLARSAYSSSPASLSNRSKALSGGAPSSSERV